MTNRENLVNDPIAYKKALDEGRCAFMYGASTRCVFNAAQGKTTCNELHGEHAQLAPAPVKRRAREL